MHAAGHSGQGAALDMARSPLLAHVRHGFTGRHGGTSQAPFDSLDLKLGEVAGRAAVRRNRQLVLEALGCAKRRFVSVKQVHQDHIVELTAQASPHIEADGIWTRDGHGVLAILTADCVPLLISDAQGQLVAAVHAGWRGTCGRIAARMVERLHSAAGVSPQQLRCVLGPAIGPCCFEIGPETALALRHAYPACPKALTAGRARKARADLWALNAQALIEAGVAPAHIAQLRICTACSTDYFSYRRQQGVCGRQASVIALR